MTRDELNRVAITNDDIVERLREGCIYYERNKLFVVDDDATDNLLSEAADLIECQREALRVAREALNVFAEHLVEKRYVEIADDAIAAIGAVMGDRS